MTATKPGRASLEWNRGPKTKGQKIEAARDRQWLVIRAAWDARYLASRSTGDTRAAAQLLARALSASTNVEAARARLRPVSVPGGMAASQAAADAASALLDDVLNQLEGVAA